MKIVRARRSNLRKKFETAAIRGNCIQVHSHLLQEPQLINFRDRNGFTALHHAATNGDQDLVILLLRRGAVNEKDNTGFTPLHHAAWKGHANVVRLLANSGADIDATDFQGDTPLMTAVFWKRPAVVNTLIALGADVTFKDQFRNVTARHYAVLSQDQEILKLIDEALSRLKFQTFLMGTLQKLDNSAQGLVSTLPSNVLQLISSRALHL
eukprot:c19386_g1_i2.p1 GENE.c19386_g1_i2~~c19386_g1_i2.p1  ORF type:complete len:210 (-),score=28.86 c19386_g1_i2:130-759(-)